MEKCPITESRDFSLISLGSIFKFLKPSSLPSLTGCEIVALIVNTRQRITITDRYFFFIKEI
jgi:hypothetical protein